MSIDEDAFRARAAASFAKAEGQQPTYAALLRSLGEAFNFLAEHQRKLDAALAKKKSGTSTKDS